MAHFALQKLRILPSTLESMSQKERAFVYASILCRIESEKKSNDEAKNKMSSSRKR